MLSPHIDNPAHVTLGFLIDLQFEEALQCYSKKIKKNFFCKIILNKSFWNIILSKYNKQQINKEIHAINDS